MAQVATPGPGPSTTAHMSAILLPGQPLPSSFTKEPRPFIGSGCYEQGGKILASVVGRARRDGSVSLLLARSPTHCWVMLTRVGSERRWKRR